MSSLISIVTPSFNQGQFLEETILSVLGQDLPKVEYLVIDGGSTDQSPEIIRRHEKRLAYWCSERDAGQYDAINKGFRLATGDVMGWLNSDDKYTPWALSIVGEIFETFPEIEWLTTLYPLRWDARGRAVRCSQRAGFSRAGFLAGETLPTGGWYAPGWLQQESTFWRRSLWERAGGALDTSWKIAADFELWARFFQHAELYAVDTPLGGFRLHGDQKTSHQGAAYAAEAEAILRAAGGRPATAGRSLLRANVGHALPDRLRPWAHRCGLLYEGKALLRQRGNNGWKPVSVHY